MNMRSAQTLVGHFSVNAMEVLLEAEQPVKTSTNVLKKAIVTRMHSAQIHQDHLTVHAKQDIRAMAEAVKVK